MGKNKQSKIKAEAFDESDMREPKEESIERDKEKGWDHEKCTKDGRDVSYAIFDKPVKKRKLIYVKLPDKSFRFSPRPDLNPLARRRPQTLPHSMLGKGGKVIGAGECETDEHGNITKANNFSGHYQPDETNMRETKKNMEDQGLSSGEAVFKVVGKSGKVIKQL